MEGGSRELRFDSDFTKTVGQSDRQTDRQTGSQRDDRCLPVRVTAYMATVNLTASDFGLDRANGAPLIQLSAG